MKVLMTADTLGGAWSHAIELASAIRRQGVHTVLAAMGRRPTRSQTSDAARVSGLDLRVAPYRLPWMKDPWADVDRAGEWLLELAADTGAELVHLSEPVFAALPWAAPVVAVGHGCVLSWFAAVRHEAAPHEWDRYRHAMRVGFAAADAVVAPSHAMLHAIERHYGITKGAVVPDGCDPARYRPGTKEPFILTAGRLWDPARNVSMLATMARHLPWPVHAVGDPVGPVDAPAAHAGPLHLLGALGSDAMADAFARASIYALPARYEPFGQSVLEAALSGCALVLGDIPSLRELWDSAALFVAPDDVTGLRSALAALIRNARLRRDLGTDARQRALEYSPERMAQGYLAVYDRLRSPACAL